MSQSSLNLNLTVEEVNVILASLSKQPYELVNAVIGNVKGQAVSQLSAASSSAGSAAEGTAGSNGSTESDAASA